MGRPDSFPALLALRVLLSACHLALTALLFQGMSPARLGALALLRDLGFAQRVAFDGFFRSVAARRAQTTSAEAQLRSTHNVVG